MYSKDYFIESFRNTSSEELLDRMAANGLTDEATAAIRFVLNERGIAESNIATLVQGAKKEAFRKTGVTNECDFCGKFSGLEPVRDQGQKFCTAKCLHSARVMEASMDISAEDAFARAKYIKNSVCPVCLATGQLPDIHTSYWIWAAVFITSWGENSKICCSRCAKKANLYSIGFSLALGWLSIKGLVMTPVQIATNIAAIMRRKRSVFPSESLVQTAKMQLADESLQRLKP